MVCSNVISFGREILLYNHFPHTPPVDPCHAAAIVEREIHPDSCCFTLWITAPPSDCPDIPITFHMKSLSYINGTFYDYNLL